MSPHQRKQHKLQRRKQRRTQRKQIFRKWHRRIGFAFSLFLFNLAITGILLNHYEYFGLHKSHVESDWLLDWYDVKAPDDIQCFKLKPTVICQIDDLVYSMHQSPQLFQEQTRPLINVVKQKETIHLVTADKNYIVDHQLNLIEIINVADEFASLIQDAFIQDNQLYFQTDKTWLVFDEDNYLLVPVDESKLAIQNPSNKAVFNLTDKSQLDFLKQNYRQKQISHLKLVQDLHSGQILANFGKWVTDLTGVAVLLLAISGFITWQRRKNSNRN